MPNESDCTSKEDEAQSLLEREHGTLEGKMGIRPLPQVATISYSTIMKPEFDLEKLKREAIAAEIQRKLDANAYFLRAIEAKYLGVGGPTERPFPSVEKELEKSSNWTITQHAQAIDITLDKIEALNSLKKTIREFSGKDRQTDAMWRNEGVPIKRTSGYHTPPPPHSLEEIERVVRLGKVEVEAVEFWVDYHTRTKEGHEAQLKKIQEAAPSIVKANLIKMAQLCETASKAKNIMIKLAREYRKHDRIDPKKAHEYAMNRQVFFTCENQYMPLQREISGLTDVTTLNLPNFPVSLTPEERKGEENILLAAGLYRPKKPKKTIHLKSITDEKGHRDRERYIETKRISAKIDEERKRLPPAVKDAMLDSTVEDLCKAFDDAGKAFANGDLEALKKNKLFRK
jgi:hypothetical protein